MEGPFSLQRVCSLPEMLSQPPPLPQRLLESHPPGEGPPVLLTGFPGARLLASTWERCPHSSASPPWDLSRSQSLELGGP